MGALKRVELVLCVTVGLPFLFKQVIKLSGFEGV